jgi:hypothetical protein
VGPAIRGTRVEPERTTRGAVYISAKRQLVRNRRPTRLGVLAIVLLTAIIAIVVQQVIAMLNRPLLADNFDRPNGLITNEFAYFNPDNRAAVRSPTWIATSGSLFVQNKAAWTGVPDRGDPGPRSAPVTDSSVFRVVTRRADFQDVTVSFSLLVQRFMTVAGSPGFQGVHVFMRYQHPDLLYVLSVDRRDGVIVIKKKVPGGTTAGGTYYTLASVHGRTVTGRWEQVRASAVNVGEGVELDVWLNGQLRLKALDNGVGDTPPITQPGRVGLRGDYTEFKFDDFTVQKR